MRKAFITGVFILGVHSGLQALVPLTDMVDTPTAITLPRGDFSVGLTGYDGGGLLTKAIIGLHDKVYLGASIDIENAIGENTARMNIPGVVGKIRFTDGWEDFPIFISLGYDSFYSGAKGKIYNAENPYNRMIYGPNVTITKPIYLFGMEQHVHGGVRTPIQPYYVPEDTSMYFSMDFPIGSFIPIFEIERIYFNNQRMKEILFNLGLRFQFFESLAIELDFMFGIDQKPNRMLVFEYIDRF